MRIMSASKTCVSNPRTISLFENKLKKSKTKHYSQDINVVHGLSLNFIGGIFNF